jgi:glycosyltransferase involved in cell wall biosynthesis
VAAPPTTWAILTGEYPPESGGVADYTRLLARALADGGDAVHVWAGPCRGATPADAGVTVRRLPSRFGPTALPRLGRELARLPRPRRVLVQYVPHAFGFKAMNLPFCLWLAGRRQERRWVMFHEVAFPWEVGRPWKHQLLGAVTAGMARLLARTADRVFVTIPTWEDQLRRVAGRLPPVTHLPVPSNLAAPDPAAVAATRHELAPAGAPLLGHFGTYGGLIAPSLRQILPPVLAALPAARAALLGRGGDAFARDLERDFPALAGRLAAPGAQPDVAVAAGLAACDLLVQPYLDGASGRRTSLTAGLALGRPVLTNAGAATEPFWAASGAVAWADLADPAAWAVAAAALLADPPARERLGRGAADLYRDRFDIAHTVAALRNG